MAAGATWLSQVWQSNLLSWPGTGPRSLQVMRGGEGAAPWQALGAPFRRRIGLGRLSLRTDLLGQRFPLQYQAKRPPSRCLGSLKQ